MNKSRSGLTLIELMVVCAIVGLLAAIVIPNFIAMQERPKNDNVNHGLSTEDRYPTAGDALVTMTNAGYLSPIITKDWGHDLRNSDCACRDLRAYEVTASDSHEEEHNFLVCCRGTGTHKACIILFKR